MKAYRFKLERLSRVRKVQEEIALAKWQAAVVEARQARARCDRAKDDIVSAITDLRLLQSSPSIDARQVLQARGAIENLEERRDMLLRLADTAQKSADILREPWQAVRTQLEGLKRLEGEERIKFRLESEREEAKHTDEQAMDRARRAREKSRRKSA